MKKLFKVWIIYEGRTLILKKKKKGIRSAGYFLAENEKEVRKKFCNTLDFTLMIENRGRITNDGYPDYLRIKIEKSYIKISTDFEKPNIKELANILSADDFLEYCKDRIGLREYLNSLV